MKLNFWQIVGIVLLVLGLILLIYREMGNDPAPAPSNTAPSATQPAA